MEDPEDDPIDAFLSGYPNHIEEICQELRVIIKSAANAGQEVLHADQNHFAYSLTGRVSEQVIYVTPMQEYARLGFYWGGELPDPSGLLEGEGKRLRHIKLRTLNDAYRPEVLALIQSAWENARAKRMGKQP